MIRTFIISFYLLASFFGMGQAIKFGSLGSGLTLGGGVRSMFYDTIDKKLYVSGQFQKADNKIVWGAAVWQNNQWDSLKGGFTQHPQQIASPGQYSDFAWKILRYKNKIFFAGGIVWVNGKNQYNLGVWDLANSSWDYPFSQPLSSGSQISDMVVYKDTLYACGLFTMIGNIPCHYVAKFDGVNWHPVGDFSKFETNSQGPAQMNAITVYNDEIYVGGAFDDSTGTPRNISKFNGSYWVNVGSGIIQSGFASVICLESFNNKLYVGGYFSKTSQIPGESLVAWNGLSYEALNGQGLTNGDYVRFFKKHKNKLFIMGPITSFASLTFQNIFYLNANNNTICNISGLESTFTNTLNSGFERCDFIEDTLVVGGLFTYLDTILVNNIGVIKNYENNSNCLITGLRESFFDNNIVKVYPNPVKNSLSLEFEAIETRNIKMVIINSVGQIVFSLDSLEQKQEIDMSFLPSGIYFLKLQNYSEQKVIKLIKD